MELWLPSYQTGEICSLRGLVSILVVLVVRLYARVATFPSAIVPIRRLVVVVAELVTTPHPNQYSRADSIYSYICNV